MNLVVNIYEFLSNLELSKELIIFIISALPVSELRGAIPVGILLFEESVVRTCFFAYIGNILPVPFLLLFFQPVSRYLSHLRFFEKYGWLGLILFVAVPLPVTGAWTGCLAASLFRLRFRYAFIAICLGVAIAGIVVTSLTVSGKLGVVYLLNNK